MPVASISTDDESKQRPMSSCARSGGAFAEAFCFPPMRGCVGVLHCRYCLASQNPCCLRLGNLLHRESQPTRSIRFNYRMILGALSECVVNLQVAQFDVAQMAGKEEVIHRLQRCR